MELSLITKTLKALYPALSIILIVIIEMGTGRRINTSHLLTTVVSFATIIMNRRVILCSIRKWFTTLFKQIVILFIQLDR